MVDRNRRVKRCWHYVEDIFESESQLMSACFKLTPNYLKVQVGDVFIIAKQTNITIYTLD